VTRLRSCLSAFALVLFLVAPAPCAAHPNWEFVMANAAFSGIFTATNLGMALGTVHDLSKPQPNRALAYSSVVLGALGIVSGAISTGFGAWIYTGTPGPDDTREFMHQLGGCYLGIGVPSVANGVFALGIGLYDLLRSVSAPAANIPRPVVFGGQTSTISNAGCQRGAGSSYLREKRP
jgi:MFS family permease